MCLDADGAEKLRATLEALKLELKSAGFATLSPNRTDDIGERDEDFQPLNEMYQILQSSRNRSTKQILSMIQTALDRFDDDPDIVGACEECEECIAPKRLAIFPYTIFCVKCQSAAEEKGIERTGRRNLTDFN